MFNSKRRSLLISTAINLLASVGIVLAGSTQITVKDGNGLLRNYDVITDQTGTNYVGMFGICDGNAAAQCVSVKPGNTQPTSSDPAMVVGIADGNNVTVGAKADSAYGGTGPASVVAAIKGVYNAATSSLATGTNVIGSVTAQLGLVGGWTPLIANSLSAATVLAIKNSPGQLGMLQCYNPNQAQSYIQVFNLAAASVSVGTTLPTLSIPIAPTATGGLALSNPGIQFNTAISLAATTTATGNTSPATPVDCNTVFN